MVVSAPATALLLAASVVATTAKALTVRAVRGVAVLAGSSATAHSVGTTVKVVSLEVTWVSAVSAAHLRVLRREATLTAWSVVSSGSGTGSASQGRRRAGAGGLGITEGLQVISRAGDWGLVLAVERLALRLKRGGSASKAVVRTAKAAATQARLTSGLAGCRAAIITEARTKAAVSVNRRRSAESARRRGVVIWRVGRHSVRLSIHSTLATVWAEPALSIA